MADQTGTSRQLWPRAQFWVTLIAVGLAALALFVALRIDRRVDLRVGDETSVQDAEAILARANEAAGFADTILSFLEGASVVVGAILAVGAWMLRNSIQNQIEETRTFVQVTEERFAEREERLNELERKLTGRLDDMVIQTRQEIDSVQQQARDSFRVLSLLVLAEQQVRAHNFDTAIRTLQTAYGLDKNNQATNYLLGYLYTTRKKFDDAIARLESALEIEPDFAPAVAALGLALRRKGDGLTADSQLEERDRLWSQAETKLLDALALDAQLTDADGESYYGTLGGLYRRQDRYDAAIHAYEKALSVTPNKSYPVSNLAALYKRQGRDVEANAYYELVLRAAALQLDDDPRDFWTRADFAQAKLVLGNTDEAKKEYGLVVEHARERVVLETVRSTLLFLAKSPTPIPGLDEVTRLIDDALDRLADEDMD